LAKNAISIFILETSLFLVISNSPFFLNPFPPVGAREIVVLLSFPAPFGGRMSARTGRGHKMFFHNLIKPKFAKVKY